MVVYFQIIRHTMSFLPLHAIRKFIDFYQYVTLHRPSLSLPEIQLGTQNAEDRLSAEETSQLEL